LALELTESWLFWNRDQLRLKADAGFKRVYFQTLGPQNPTMTELLADTLKGML
jgi:hypothetical protein